MLKFIRNGLAIVTLIVAPWFSYAVTSKLISIQVTSTPTQSRIQFNFTQPTLYRLFSLNNPPRLALDVQDTQLNTALSTLKFSDPNIKSVRTGHPVPNTLRLVFDLKVMTQYKIIANDKKIILEINTAALPIAAEKPVIINKPSPVMKLAKATPAQVLHPIVVVIDPGHGGKDPGALGALGDKEKNVVLAIAKDLAEMINKQTHMRAILTRQGDYFVTLRERLKLARKGNADIFMSIHADSYFNDQASGVSVYALSRRGATSEAARWLAQRDNYSELSGVDLKELGDQSYLLRSVLIDLAQTATITDSIRLGTLLLDSLDRVTRLHYPRVEQAPFVVLKSPDIPSVLVETGFISSPKEEIRLRDPQQQKLLAKALFDGLQRYLKKYSITSGVA